MKTTYLLLLFLISVTANFAQTTISGTVTDKKNMPIAGANVFIEGTYDGSSTDNEGNFSFSTSETGNQTLVISFISFQTQNLFYPVENHGRFTNYFKRRCKFFKQR